MPHMMEGRSGHRGWPFADDDRFLPPTPASATVRRRAMMARRAALAALSGGILALAHGLAPAPLRAQAPGAQSATAALPSVRLPPPLERVLRDYEKAWRAGDAGALALLFTPDGFVLANGRAPVRGRDAIRKAYQGQGGPLSLRAIAFATADTVGYIIGAYSYAPDGGDEGKFTLTLRRSREGRWLIASDMDNPNRPPRRPVTPAAQPAAPPPDS